MGNSTKRIDKLLVKCRDKYGDDGAILWLPNQSRFEHLWRLDDDR